jgi:hypothetical protein
MLAMYKKIGHKFETFSRGHMWLQITKYSNYKLEKYVFKNIVGIYNRFETTKETTTKLKGGLLKISRVLTTETKAWEKQRRE